MSKNSADIVRPAMGFYFSHILSFKKEVQFLLPIHIIKHASSIFYPFAIKLIIDNYIPTRDIKMIVAMGIIALCAYGIMNGWLLMGTLVLFLSYINQITNSINNLINQFPQITQFAESVASINEILNSEEESEVLVGKQILDKVHGDYSFENVTFSYDGTSGSGKSTFVNLAIGLFQPMSGTIKIDGLISTDINMRELRKSVGVVTQDPILFRGTIAENIAHGRDYSSEQIEYAANIANAHEFISKLPYKYDSIIGDS